MSESLSLIIVASRIPDINININTTTIYEFREKKIGVSQIGLKEAIYMKTDRLRMPEQC